MQPEPLDNLTPGSADPRLARLDSPLVESSPSIDCAVDSEDVGRGRGPFFFKTNGEHPTPLVDEGLRQVSWLQVGASQVLDELPRRSLIRGQRTWAQHGRNGLKVRILGLINSTNTTGPQPSLSGNKTVRTVGKFFDKDGL